MVETTGNAPKALSGQRSKPMKRKAKYVPKKDFRPGGQKGKLHRELGIKEGAKIPAARLSAAMHSPNREVRDDAIRAHTMEGWHHGAHAYHPPARG